MGASTFRIRSLSDLESQLNSLRPEYQSIKMSLSSQKEQPDPAEEELNSLWDETEKAVSDRLVINDVGLGQRKAEIPNNNY